MADYFTSFSCLFDVGSAANAVRARSILAQLEQQLESEADGAAVGFTMQSDECSGPGVLCLYSEEDGEPEHVIAFVKLCAEAFALTGRWGFHWALTCSRPRPGGFGDDGHVLDLATGETIDWMDCEHWLVSQLAAASTVPQGVPSLARASETGRSCWGVVTVGQPLARAFDPRQVVEATRLCVRRDRAAALRWNACSTLYGWAARKA